MGEREREQRKRGEGREGGKEEGKLQGKEREGIFQSPTVKVKAV